MGELARRVARRLVDDAEVALSDAFLVFEKIREVYEKTMRDRLWKHILWFPISMLPVVFFNDFEARLIMMGILSTIYALGAMIIETDPKIYGKIRDILSSYYKESVRKSLEKLVGELVASLEHRIERLRQLNKAIKIAGRLSDKQLLDKLIEQYEKEEKELKKELEENIDKFIDKYKLLHIIKEEAEKVIEWQ